MLTAAITETGNEKSINQDSILLKTARISGKEAALIAVCDGMGGMESGEEASKEATLFLNRWFVKIFPYLINEKEDFFSLFQKTLTDTINKADKSICEKYDGQSGTTMCAVLIYEDSYYTVNVGDSRGYKVTDKKIYQLTKDQTYVQMLVDQGRLDKKDIYRHPKRNVLLQCIGTGDDIEPIFTQGKTRKGDLFFVCSDGFRHKVERDIFFDMLLPSYIQNEYILEETLQKLVDLNLDRGERDNISVVSICLK